MQKNDVRLARITPLVLTFNEAANIGRTLSKLVWAKKIIIVDSFSTDKTLEIISKYSSAEVVQRKFDNFASQTNWGLDHIKSDWVLSIDADYILTDELVEEIKNLDLILTTDGYFAPFKYCVAGKPLRSTLLPPREVLFRREKGRYVQDGHAHKLVNAGKTNCLKNFIYHDDRKPFSRWWAAQKKYAVLEARKLTITTFGQLNPQDKLRKMIFFAPGIVFLYCLFWRGLILDGWNGLIYSAQRFLAELLLSCELIKKLIKK